MLESTDMFNSYYYNKKTKEILFHSDFDEEMSTITEADAYIKIVSYFSFLMYGYLIMIP